MKTPALTLLGCLLTVTIAAEASAQKIYGTDDAALRHFIARPRGDRLCHLPARRGERDAAQRQHGGCAFPCGEQLPTLGAPTAEYAR